MKISNKILLNLLGTAVLVTTAYSTCATNVDMGNHRIVNVSDPIDDKDVVTKKYLFDIFTKRFVRDDVKQIVFDVTTNLMWQDNAAAASTQKRWLTVANYVSPYNNTSGDTATTYCRNLSLGGYTDWRLPSKDELYGIVKSTVINPSISGVFQHTASDYYWSSTTYAGSSSDAWDVYFGNGYQHYYYKTGSGYVRCVRAGQ